MRTVLGICASLLLAACGGSSNSSPSSPSPTPSPSSTIPNPNLTQNKLLTDAELLTPALSPAPTTNQAYADWLKENHYLIRSITYDQDFSDLEFLAPMIGDRSLVQLGESSHGTREFNHIKTRLIKYLHQEMGFTVLAFESGFFEGAYADSIIGTGSADNLLRFPFGVWATDEVLEAFQYIKDTQSTASPMRLAGFDTQISSNYFSRLPDFVTNLPTEGIFDDDLRLSLANDFRQFRDLQIEYSSGQCFLSTNANNAACTQISDAFVPLQNRFELAQDELASVTSPSRNLKIVRIATFAASAQIGKSKVEKEGGDASSFRDENMAEIFGMVREDLFPSEKIIVWAHNRHIAHEQSVSRSPNAANLVIERPMGSFLKAEFPEDIFTIGLYMLRGETADNSGHAIPVLDPTNGSLEALAYSVRKAALYLDTRSDQLQVDGNAFLFDYVRANYWGGSFGSYEIIPADQFDGLLFIDDSNLPNYR
ncbi:MAG: erythromycin esterase family protein [Litorimonas sp.]